VRNPPMIGGYRTLHESDYTPPAHLAERQFRDTSKRNIEDPLSNRSQFPCPRRSVPRLITRSGTVLFATAGFQQKPHAEGMRILGFMGDLLGGALMVLAVPIAVLAVGVPIALVVRIILSAVGLL
jgi:hypothetical protein